MARLRLPLALATTLVWLLILIWDAWNPHDASTLNAGIQGSVNLQMVYGAVFLAVVVVAMRWTNVGFRAPTPWSSLRILLLPAIYLVLFLGLTLLVGWPSPSTIGFLAINTLIVGFSEELAFRGILFRGLCTRLSLWPAFWATSIIFGSVHIFNGFTTHDWLSAAVQATTAFMAGTFFLALVLRTKSILPGMLFHACWDFLLTMSATGLRATGQASALPGMVHIIGPFVLDAPLFIYALFLLRKVKDEAPQPSSAAKPQPVS